VLWNLFSKHPRVGDVLLAGAAMLLSLGEAKGHAPFGTVIAIAFLASLPLLARRRYPVPVLGLVLAVTVVAEFILHRTIQLPAALAIYSVAALRDRDTSLRACGLAVIVLFLPFPRFAEWIPPIPAVAAWVLGDTLRVRRAQLRAEREESARRAATEEQVRIAREPPATAGENCVAGEVMGIGYLGDLSIYQVRLDNGYVMKAAAANMTRLIERPIGWNDRVWLTWAPEAGVVLTR